MPYKSDSNYFSNRKRLLEKGKVTDVTNIQSIAMNSEHNYNIVVLDKIANLDL